MQIKTYLHRYIVSPCRKLFRFIQGTLVPSYTSVLLIYTSVPLINSTMIHTYHVIHLLSLLHKLC